MPRQPDNSELTLIRRQVGEATPEQLRYVECFVADPVSLFVPAVGPCQYALAKDHTHPGYLFLLAFDRNTAFVADGRTLVSEPGMVIAIAPGAPHHELAQDEPPRYVAICIDRAHFEAQLAHYHPTDRPNFHLRAFMNECEADLPGRATLLAAMGVRITHSLLRAALGVKPPAPAADSIRLEVYRAIQHMHDHFAERLTVAELARVAGISPSHFSRLFRRETGHSPLAYLIRVRIQRGRQLLRAGGDPVSTIAFKCGFATPSHFTDCFRKQCGLSPSEYLKSRK
jgi:AraC-like DNA-binding protein